MTKTETIKELLRLINFKTQKVVEAIDFNGYDFQIGEDSSGQMVNFNLTVDGSLVTHGCVNIEQLIAGIESIYNDHISFIY